MKRKLMYSINGLKKYFRLSELSAEVKKAELLSSNEALKSFGKLWRDHQADTMMMLEVIKTQYIEDMNFTEQEIGAVKKTLADVAKFLRGCSGEWNEFEKEQARKQEK